MCGHVGRVYQRIARYCFGSCGKILVGSILIPVGDGALQALACREDVCPALDRQMDEAMGTVPHTDEPLYLRKLREGNVYG